MATGLCETCVYSIWCPTWGEWKCKNRERRIYGTVTTCHNYSKRPKDFKEPKCQCKNCLENELLMELEDEEKEIENGY